MNQVYENLIPEWIFKDQQGKPYRLGDIAKRTNGVWGEVIGYAKGVDNRWCLLIQRKDSGDRGFKKNTYLIPLEEAQRGDSFEHILDEYKLDKITRFEALQRCQEMQRGQQCR